MMDSGGPVNDLCPLSVRRRSFVVRAWGWALVGTDTGDLAAAGRFETFIGPLVV